MLTEQFIASIGVPAKAPGTNVVKDAAIFVYEHQPLLSQKAIFKKSATAPNCLAVSQSHIFAAQSEKAVVHVYNRDKGNQESVVPFTERISCLTLACDGTFLILGTAEGRILVWEITSGRQIMTVQSHLQAVTGLAIDTDSNFLLSASADSTVQVWSISSLIDFTNGSSEPPSPLHTFSSHRAAITALTLGHSSTFRNFVVSTAEDKTCFIWDYQSNQILRTYLLPSVPTALALDPADRAFYVGFEDGSVQQIDFFTTLKERKLNLNAVQDREHASAPIQPEKARLWLNPEAIAGRVLSLSISFGATTLLSGHQSGAILAWDVATGLARSLLSQGPLPGPVTNIQTLPVHGFHYKEDRRLAVETAVKPKFGAFSNAVHGVPGNYSLNIQLTGKMPPKGRSSQSVFSTALTAPSFPVQLIEEGLSELQSRDEPEPKPRKKINVTSESELDDFMALDEKPKGSEDASLAKRNGELEAQLAALRKVQQVSFEKIEKLNVERKALLLRERRRMASKDDGDLSDRTGSSDESDE